VIPAGAVCDRGRHIRETGRLPQSRPNILVAGVIGDGTQLLMPALVDAQ